MRVSDVLFVLPALGLAACAAREATSPAVGPRPWRELPEFRMLSGTFEASAVGVGGDTPLSAVAFARLVLRDDASAVFEDLLREEDLASRVYGLKGLWFADRARYRRAAVELARVDRDVPALIGCISGKVSLRSVAGEAPEGWSDWRSPVALFHAGVAWLEEANPRDLDAGKWRSTLVDPDQPEDHRLWAARALAYSLEGPGLDALLGSLPSLDPEMRSSVLDLLEGIPPWNRGAFESVKKALEEEDGIVQQGALRAMWSLTNYGWTRRECRQLVPRMEKLLADFAAKEAALEEAQDEEWLSEMLVALRDVGGPAGPVLARALAHHEMAIDFTTLGEWADETIGELVGLLGHPEADVRGRAAAMLCLALDPGHPSLEPRPPAVRRAVERRLPVIRGAIAALEDPERAEIEKDLARALEGAPDSP